MKNTDISKHLKILLFTIVIFSTLAVKANAQNIDYNSRHVSCDLLKYELDRIIRENEDGFSEGIILTVVRALTFPMFLLEPISGYTYEVPPTQNIKGSVYFSGNINELYNAAKRRNCLSIVPKLREMEANNELNNYEPVNIAERIKKDGFYFGAPFKGIN